MMETKKVSPIIEILKDANSAIELQGLINLWNEIAKNKYQYPLSEIRSANEHIRELALKVNGSDIDKGEFYLALKMMYSNEMMTKTLYDIWVEKTSTAHAEGLLRFVFTYNNQLYFSEWVISQWNEPTLIEEL